jgi:hypothetical protein
MGSLFLLSALKYHELGVLSVMEETLAGTALWPGSIPKQEQLHKMSDSSDIAERIAIVETKTDAIVETLRDIKTKLDSNDSPTGFARWFYVGPVLGFLFALMGGGFWYLDGTAIPRAITAQGSAFTPRFDGLDERMKKLESSVETIGNKLGLTISIVGPANPRTMKAALDRETSVDQSSVAQALPNVTNILKVVRNMHVRMRSGDYDGPSRRLFDHYARAKEPEKDKIWDVLLDMANTRTTSDSVTSPVSQVEIDAAKAAKVKNYFEGEEVDLNSRIAWHGTIFKNCKIKISNPSADLGLENVRFVDCDFSAIEDDKRTTKIMGSVIQSSSDRISVAVPNFKVLRPYFRLISIHADK